jgi:hypothetical protein
MRILLAVAALACLAARTAAAADAGASPALVQQLVSVMADGHLDSIAAADPASPDGFIAARLYPGVQLLVVSGTPLAPAQARQQLEQRQFGDVYVTLHQAVQPDSKWFVQDMQANGLRADDRDAVDIVYERVTEQLLFDGEPGKRDVSSADYRRQFERADQKYSTLLSALIEAARRAAAMPSTR